MYEEEYEIAGQGLRMTINCISGFVVPLIVGALITISWQLPFLLYALAIPIAPIVYLWFDEPVDRTDSTGGEGDSSQYRRRLRALLTQWRAMALIIGRALPMIIWIAFLTYNSLIVVRILDDTTFEAGVLAAIGNIELSSVTIV